jgi:hypothetical protein
MAFHDLTEDQSAPPEAKFLMGLGDTFIPVPKETKEDNCFTGITRFERSLLIKIIFAPGPEGLPDLSSEEDKETKLYVNSTWCPGYGDVPCWVSKRASRFFSKVYSRFRKRTGVPKLLPFQQQMLNDLLNHPTLLFPTTDKGLGPCAVKYEQYVSDGLIHLTNAVIYEQLSADSALQAVLDLQEKIEEWLEDNEHIVPDTARLGLRGHNCMDWAVFSSARSSAERCEQLEAEESSERDSMASFAASQVKSSPSCHPRRCPLD